MSLQRKCIIAACAALVGASLGTAQDEPQELDAFISEEVPIEESILPTTRPFSSVYGTDRSILDTPRNVTIISREQLDAISIKTPRDFALLTSSSYTKSNFGAPTSPNLRGQEADLFVNGIRKGLTSNGNGLPINFNAVESVNIVKGPAGSVYGTSNYLGGYADLITKRAFFDAAHGTINATIGSYDTAFWQLDYSTPISDDLAVRFSYSGENTLGYYRDGKRKTQAFYATATYRPSEKYELFVAAEFFVADYTENWGVNRPTQDLIDHGLYIPNAQTDAEYAAYVALLGNGAGYFSGGTPGVDYASVFGGGGFATIIPADVANPVKIDRSRRMLAPGDDSFGKNFWAQAINTFYLSDDVKLENNSYFQWIDRNTFSSYHYSELLRDNWSFDNRLQVVMEKESWDLNAGLRYRLQHVWEVHHFFNEPANFWDLTRDPDLTRVPDQAFAGFLIVADEEPHDGLLQNWYYGADGSETDGGDTGADTDAYILGPFAQFTYRPGEQWIFDLSYGFDYVDAQETNPVPVTGGGFDNSDSATVHNYNGSVTFKVSELATVYATYGFSESIPVDTGGRITPGSLEIPQESELLEIGAKFQLIDKKLFVGTALFDREFIVTNSANATRDTVYLKGLEVEFNYQPNKNFYATFGYSFIDAERTAGFFATAYTIDRAGETGGFYVAPSFPGPDDESTKFKYPGQPEHQFTALTSYKFDSGLGVQLNAWMTGPMKLGYEGFITAVPSATEGFDNPYILEVSTVEIPWQFEINATVFYEWEDWRFKITAFNITGEENWDAPNAGYGNGSVVPREPVRFEGTVTYKF